MYLGVLKNSTAYPYLFLLDFLGLIQYTSKNLTFKGSPERLTRCQIENRLHKLRINIVYLILFCKYLTETLRLQGFSFSEPLKI